VTLTLANVEVVYSDVVVGLRGVSLTVPPGAIVALLGANGAGKTTCLRAISGLLDVHRGKITKGAITFEGERIDHSDATQIVRRDALSDQPDMGKPLRRELEGFWSARVGRHRVSYRWSRSRLDVILVGPRATIYEEASRLRRRRC
jgi:branched-chain amino acid transport system ATP-binding protein